MKQTFVLQTNDDNMKKSLSEFLVEYCDRNNFNAHLYELNDLGADKVMNIVLEDEVHDIRGHI